MSAASVPSAPASAAGSAGRGVGGGRLDLVGGRRDRLEPGEATGRGRRVVAGRRDEGHAPDADERADDDDRAHQSFVLSTRVRRSCVAPADPAWSRRLQRFGPGGWSYVGPSGHAQLPVGSSASPDRRSRGTGVHDALIDRRGATLSDRGISAGHGQGTLRSMAELFIGGSVDPATHERTGDDVRIDTSDLTTHGVIVGMTGSGKTGLGVVLVEEILSAGLPALLVDPKGDLTNLCLSFPTLAAGRLPAVDRRGPGPRGRPVGRRLRRRPGRDAGPRDWPAGATDPAQITKLREAVDLTIYTPGSTAGTADQPRRFARRPRRPRTTRRSPTRSRGPCRACSAWSASPRIRWPVASTSCCRTSSATRGTTDRRSTWPR